MHWCSDNSDPKAYSGEDNYINGKAHSLPTTKDYLLQEYAEVFQGKRTLPGGPYRIKLKEGYKPVQRPPR